MSSISQSQSRKSLSEYRKEDDLVRRALRLRDEGKLEEASEIFLDLANRHPRVAGPRGVLAGLYYRLGRFSESADCFRRAVEINPRSELANRGLFHALWRLGKNEEAIAVIRNYTELTGSDVFLDILRSYEREMGADSS